MVNGKLALIDFNQTRNQPGGNPFFPTAFPLFAVWCFRGSRCAGWRGRGLRNTSLSPFQLSEWISIVLPRSAVGRAEMAQFNLRRLSINRTPKENILKEPPPQHSTPPPREESERYEAPHSITLRRDRGERRFGGSTFRTLLMGANYIFPGISF